MNNVISETSAHTLAMIRRVTIEVGKDEEIKDSENFQDIRMEMNSIGLNLVSLFITVHEIE